MFRMYINGIPKGYIDTKNIINFLNHQGFFDESIPKPNNYNNRTKLITDLKKWKIGMAGFLDDYHIWRVKKVK